MKKLILFLLTVTLYNNGMVYAEEFKEIVPLEQRLLENSKSKKGNFIENKKVIKIDDTIQKPKLTQEIKKEDIKKTIIDETTQSIEETIENKNNKEEIKDLTKNNFFQSKPKVTKEQFTGRILDLSQKNTKTDGIVYANDETVPYTGKFALFLGDFIEYTETYKNGVLEGPKTWYAENGNIVLEETYNNNRIEGPQKAYYENGNIKSIVDYKNNRVVGITAYSKDGKILHQDNFKNGNGKWKYFWSNGKVLEEGQYKNWVKDGIWKKYREDGEVDSITEYKNGRLVETTWN